MSRKSDVFARDERQEDENLNEIDLRKTDYQDGKQDE